MAIEDVEAWVRQDRQAARALETALKGAGGGQPGPTGPKGMQWRGPWNGTTAYVTDDVVSHLGSSWIALSGSTGKQPSVESAWDLVAKKGGKGDPGTDGGGGSVGPFHDLTGVLPSDGNSDCADAVSAAINKTQGDNRGIFIFPEGRYRFSKPVPLEWSGANIQFRGCGDATYLYGDFPGYIFQRAVPDGGQLPGEGSRGGMAWMDMFIHNPNPKGGCIRVEGTNIATLKRLLLVADNPVRSYRTMYNLHIEDCDLRGVAYHTSVGVIGSACHLNNCSVVGFFQGVRIAFGGSIRSSRIEMCVTGAIVGRDENNNKIASGAVIEATSFEANFIGIHLHTFNAGSIRSVSIQGSTYAPHPPGAAQVQGNSYQGLLVQGGEASTIQGVSANSYFDSAAVEFNDTRPLRTVVMGCTAWAKTAPNGVRGKNWILPSDQSGTTFIQCNETATQEPPL